MLVTIPFKIAKWLKLFSEYSDEFAVRRLFIFIKDNLNFETLQDELTQKNLICDKEREDYICQTKYNHLRSERLLKLIIRKKRCPEFVTFMKEMPDHRCKDISDKILELQEKVRETQEASEGNVIKISYFIFVI